jgi:hypothetical protein
MGQEYLASYTHRGWANVNLLLISSPARLSRAGVSVRLFGSETLTLQKEEGKDLIPQAYIGQETPSSQLVQEEG